MKNPSLGFRFCKALIVSTALVVIAACGNDDDSGTTPPPPSAPQNYVLSLQISGTGTVKSAPTGIDCTTSCNAEFASGTALVLTATPSAGQSFTGWTGACSGAQTTCAVTLDQALSVTSTFIPSTGQTSYALSLSVSGNGRVASSPSGIDCGTTCSAGFTAGTSVTLTATPSAGQVFSRWEGACAGTQPTCVLALSQVRTAQAVFAAAPAGITFQTSQLLENSDDFNIGRTLLAVNRGGDVMTLWEQSDGSPSGGTLKVYSRRYQAATGWQAATAIAGLSRLESNPSLLTGQLLLDDAGVATWINATQQTRRNSASSGWGTAFSAPAPRVSQLLTSTSMDSSGNIRALRSGSDVEYSTLPAGGVWSAWTRLDTAGNLVAELAQLAFSANGTALAIWRESNPGDSNYSIKAARYTPAAGWGAPESIETLFTNVADATPSLAIDAQGNGIAMWQQGSNPAVHYNTYRTGSGWQTAVDLASEAQSLPSANIQLAMSPDGRAVATWGLPGGLGTLRGMQYNLTTGWTTPTTIAGSNIGRQMFIDTTGQAIMVYQAIDAATARIDLFSRSLNFGSQWSAANVIESGAGSVSSSRFAINQNGQGAAVWVQNDVANSSARNSLWTALLR
jgi:Divergent InlB B-repeat domain